LKGHNSMMENRSVPPGGVIPFLVYDDVPQAIEWLSGAFGFRERLRTPPDDDGSIHLAQVFAGDGSVMLRTRAAELRGQPRHDPAPSLLVRVDDVDAHYARARAFGAKIVREPKTAEFGERQYTAEDPGGYQWTFSQTLTDIDPASWGAIIKNLR
jgi:uncharacterized glyoxalase superfamily protein PhnB